MKDLKVLDKWYEKYNVIEIPLEDLYCVKKWKEHGVAEAIPRYKDSIVKDGLWNPLVAIEKNGKHILLCGCHRQRALLELGYTNAPVIVVSNRKEAVTVCKSLRNLECIKPEELN